MKRLIFFLLLALPLAVFAQFNNNPNKIRLGYQTTGTGLIAYGNGAPLYTPVNVNNANHYQDTTANIAYYYDFQNNTWVKTGTPIVNEITDVADTSGISGPKRGDVFVNSTADTLGFWNGANWVLFFGGDGNGIPEALPLGNVTVNADTNHLVITNLGNLILTGNGTFTIQKNDAGNLNIKAPDGTVSVEADNVSLKGDTTVAIYVNGVPQFSAGLGGLAVENASALQDDPDPAFVMTLPDSSGFMGRIPVSDFGSLLSIPTIYSADGSLPSNRTIGLGTANNLIFQNTGTLGTSKGLIFNDQTLFENEVLGIEFQRGGTPLWSIRSGLSYPYIQHSSSIGFGIFGSGGLLTGTDVSTYAAHANNRPSVNSLWVFGSSGPGLYVPWDTIVTAPVLDDSLAAVRADFPAGDGNGIYDGSGTVGSGVVASVVDSFYFDSNTTDGFTTVQTQFGRRRDFHDTSNWGTGLDAFGTFWQDTVLGYKGFSGALPYDLFVTEAFRPSNGQYSRFQQSPLVSTIKTYAPGVTQNDADFRHDYIKFRSGTSYSSFSNYSQIDMQATAGTVSIRAAADLSLSSTGGGIKIGGSTTPNELRFMEPSGSGGNYTGFKAQAQAGNVVYTLPAADGSAGQVLSTNGSGDLTWEDDSIGSSDNIYNTDGSLTGTRKMSSAGNKIEFAATGFAQTDNTLMIFDDETTLNNGAAVSFQRNGTQIGSITWVSNLFRVNSGKGTFGDFSTGFGVSNVGATDRLLFESGTGGIDMDSDTSHVRLSGAGSSTILPNSAPSDNSVWIHRADGWGLYLPLDTFVTTAMLEDSLAALPGPDGNGIYDGSGTAPSATIVTLTDNITITGVDGDLQADYIQDGNAVIIQTENTSTGTQSYSITSEGVAELGALDAAGNIGSVAAETQSAHIALGDSGGDLMKIQLSGLDTSIVVETINPRGMEYLVEPTAPVATTIASVGYVQSVAGSVSISPSRSATWIDEFSTGSTEAGEIGDLGWSSSGAGSVGPGTFGAGHPGVAVKTNATNGTAGYMFLGSSASISSLIYPDDIDEFYFVIELSSVSNVACYVGFASAFNATPPSNFVGVRFDTVSDTEFKAHTRVGGSDVTTTTTGVTPVASNWYTLHFVRTSSTAFDVTVNGGSAVSVSVSGMTSTLAPGIIITPSESASKQIGIDFFSIKTVELSR